MRNASLLFYTGVLLMSLRWHKSLCHRQYQTVFMNLRAIERKLDRAFLKFTDFLLTNNGHCPVLSYNALWRPKLPYNLLNYPVCPTLHCFALNCCIMHCTALNSSTDKASHCPGTMHYIDFNCSIMISRGFW